MYSHVRKLVKADPDDVAVERDMGSWWHMLRAADSIDRGVRLGSLQWMPEELTTTDDGPTLPAEDASPAKVIELAETWYSKQSSTVRDAWQERIGEQLPDRLVALDERWRARWGADIAHERPLAVELRWERQLPPLPQPAALGGPSVVDPHTVLVGYVDEVYQDVRRMVIAARDHKLHKRLGTQTAAGDMMDSQLQIYAWGASPTVTAWGLGSIRATAYDRVRMIRPPTPQVTASGGLSKSVSDFDLRTYLEWAKGPDGKGVPWGEEGKFFASGPRKGLPKFGLYVAEQKEIDRLSSPVVSSAWFQRTLTPLNPHLIRAHLRAAVDSALDVEQSYQRAQIENAAARNLAKKVCDWCDFAELCRTEMFGGAGGEYNLADFRLQLKEARR
jgi:hypothetical protein